MLIRATVENFKSFDKKEELSMVSSSKIQSKKSHRVKVKQTKILKNAAIYGANASGKSNLTEVFAFIKHSLLEGLPTGSDNYYCRNKESNKARESIFELQFTVGDTFYAYGFSAVLSQGKITGEWLYELLQDGGARMLFTRDGSCAPVIGDKVKFTVTERKRFNVYSEDFAGQEMRLFLSEMNRGKKYTKNSNLRFFQETFTWIMNNIIIINPDLAIFDTDIYYNEESLEDISRLIQVFDTGISDVKIKRITVDEMCKIMPAEIVQEVFSQLKIQMELANLSYIKVTWRTSGGFFNISITDNSEPEISTLVLRHGKSNSDFNFTEESDGTKRLFDLIDMLITQRPDTVFIVDELERSLHPKLTELFLKLFMEAHYEARMQLVFTTHEDSIMDQELFRRDEIWFIERYSDNASKIYSLDRFKERYDKKLSKAYIEGRYGAIPVFNL